MVEAVIMAGYAIFFVPKCYGYTLCKKIIFVNFMNAKGVLLYGDKVNPSGLKWMMRVAEVSLQCMNQLSIIFYHQVRVILQNGLLYILRCRFAIKHSL